MSAQQGLLLIAVFGGISVSLQAHFLSLMDKRVGTFESVFITYAIGGLLAALVMLFYRGHNLAAAQHLPWYVWTSGALGLIIVGAIGYSTPRLGLVTALAIVVGAQFITGALIDQFGLLGAEVRPLDTAKLAGLGLIVTGIWLTLR